MKKALFISISMSLLFLSFCQQKAEERAKTRYEITEVDIFSLEKLPSVEEVTVYGISIKSSFKESLEKFDKTEANIKHSEGDEDYFIELEPGLVLFSKDKEAIQSIVLSKRFKNKCKGKTASYFNLITHEEFKAYITGKFGKPDYTYNNRTIMHSKSGFIEDAFYYLNGFIFERAGFEAFTGFTARQKRAIGEEFVSMMEINSRVELTPKENIIYEAEKRGAEKARN